ncbi:MAG: hypothetical protein ACR2GN_00745 [Bacteroidia bacterium]|nr:hypothetical protein [Nitrosopumilus sp.]
MELEEPFKTEMTQFCDENYLNAPDYSSDIIPVTLLIPILKYFIDLGHVKVETLKMERFVDSNNSIIDFVNKNIFEIYEKVRFAKYIRSGNRLNFILPDFDSPYIIISGGKSECSELITKTKLETFNTDSKTKFDWWNEK